MIPIFIGLLKKEAGKRGDRKFICGATTFPETLYWKSPETQMAPSRK
jgi:hypothetical protein